MSEQLLSTGALHEKIEEMSQVLVDLTRGARDVAMIGVRSRGVLLAKRLLQILADQCQWDVPLGILDITLYRDDLSSLAPNPIVRKTEIDFDVNDKTILLIDDVLYTGRSIRSAMDHIIDFGRPRAIRLGVLVDRGGRELPIQADYVGLRVDARPDQIVRVCFEDLDDRDEVLLDLRENESGEVEE